MRYWSRISVLITWQIYQTRELWDSQIDRSVVALLRQLSTKASLECAAIFIQSVLDCNRKKTGEAPWGKLFTSVINIMPWLRVWQPYTISIQLFIRQSITHAHRHTAQTNCMRFGCVRIKIKKPQRCIRQFYKLKNPVIMIQGGSLCLGGSFSTK